MFNKYPFQHNYMDSDEENDEEGQPKTKPQDSEAVLQLKHNLELVDQQI